MDSNATQNQFLMQIKIEDIIKNVFCNAIASKKNVRMDINNIFNKRKLEYLNACKESNIYNSNITRSVDFETEFYSNKVLGILEYSIRKNDFKDILTLYKKSFRKIYNEFKDKSDISLKNLFSRISDGFEGNNEVLSTFYMLHLQENFDLEELKSLDFMVEIIKDIAILSLYKSTNFSKEQMKQNREYIAKWKNFLGIENKTYNAYDLIGNIIDKDIEDKDNKKFLVNDIFLDYNYIQKRGKRSKYIGAYEGFCKYLNYHTGVNLKSISLTKSEINELILNLKHIEMFNDFKENEYIEFLISIIYIFSINKDYRKIRERYIKEVSEEYISNINKLEMHLKDSTEKTKRFKNELKLKEKALAEKENNLLAEIEKLKNENKKLKLESNKNEGLKEEVVKLRNFIFELDKHSNDLEPNTDDVTSNIDIDLLNKKNITVIGGGINWRKKMKELFPNWSFISEDDKNKDLKFLKNNDFIFINIKMPHALYFKVKPILEKEKIPYNYINNYTNIDNSILDIQRILNENKI